MKACIQTLARHNSGPTPVYVFEQLCNIVCPAKEVPDRLLVWCRTGPSIVQRCGGRP
jgi:hypothetical protein